MKFFLTDLMSHEVIIRQKEQKKCLFSQVVYFGSAFDSNILVFLVFSLFVSTSIYLISWHYRTTHGSYIAVTSPTFSLRSGKNSGQGASC